MPNPSTAELSQESDIMAELEQLRAKVRQLNTELGEARQHENDLQGLYAIVARRKAEVVEAQEEVKKRKATLDEAVSSLHSAIAHRDGQRSLPFGDDDVTPGSETPAVTDKAGFTLLCEIGLSEFQVEALARVDAENVAELEKLMAAGKFVKGAIKGFGEANMAQVSDKLAAFRAKSPNPMIKPPARVDGQWDATQYTAGEIAFADGKALGDNPHKPKSHAHEAWAAGWREKQIQTPPTRMADKKQDPEPESVLGYYAQGCEAAIKGEPRKRGDEIPEGNARTAWLNGWDMTNGSKADDE